MDLVAVFALFVFMLALLCFSVAAVFSANKDLYKNPRLSPEASAVADGPTRRCFMRKLLYTAWNSLPVALRSSDVTEETFGRHLKTFLFNCLDN